jgi:DHA2 family multidrug resistance protein
MDHSAAAPSTGGLAVLYQEILRQASMLSFNDTFYALAIATATLIPLTLLMRKGRSGAPSSGAGIH